MFPEFTSILEIMELLGKISSKEILLQKMAFGSNWI